MQAPQHPHLSLITFYTPLIGHILHASCNCVWTLNCTCGAGWMWSTVKYNSHFLSQLTQSLAGRWNLYGKGCKTTVGVIRKDKRENAVNGPGHMTTHNAWTNSIVGGHIRSDHIKYSKIILFYVPPLFPKKLGLYENVIRIINCEFGA